MWSFQNNFLKVHYLLSYIASCLLQNIFTDIFNILFKYVTSIHLFNTTAEVKRQINFLQRGHATSFLSIMLLSDVVVLHHILVWECYLCGIFANLWTFWGVPLEHKHTDVLKVRKSQHWAPGETRRERGKERRRGKRNNRKRCRDLHVEQISQLTVSREYTCERCGANMSATDL